MPPGRGRRGELYVVIQFVLLALVIVGPVQVGQWPVVLPDHVAMSVAAIGLVLGGALLLITGSRRLGRNLTPLPYPKPDGTLVEQGIYRYVRHPIYGGLMLLAAGWSLRRGGGLVIGYTLLLAALLVAKARVEEQWLTAKHHGYPAYKARTRRFLPFVW